MATNYKAISEGNIKKYGTDIDRYGPVLLAKLYSDRTHFVYELLQNAEDAKATWVKFHLSKDRLEYRHNGRLFNQSDVQGICGLVESTKKEDLTQIGKFGIGFKSIYAYTSTPKIFSGDESFCIENYVQPRAIEKEKIKDNETLFIFLLNHREVDPENAFEEISLRLQELGTRTILFLNNIQKVYWEIESGEYGTYKRNIVSEKEHQKRVRLISETKNMEKADKEDWLIFDRPIKNSTKLKVEIAFKITENNKDNEKTDIVEPVNDSCLVVFFPTEKETHLKFLIQGPYRTTPARDNIPKDDIWNAELIQETALLVANTLTEIKKLKLITIDFLEILPINKESFPEDRMFRPVYDAVLKKLKSDEKLLPANDGIYISAKQAFLAEVKGLINLLDTKHLSLLFGKQECQWLDSNITQYRTPELRKYLIEDVGVKEITPEDFAKQFTEEFIKQQKNEWVIKFYTFLKDQKDLWRKEDWRPEGPWRSKQFIRLENNNHVTPFDSSGKPQAYLPGNANIGFRTEKTVKKVIADDKEAREFLEELGLPKLDIHAEVIETILPKYQKDEIDISNDENLDDVKKIIYALKNALPDKKEELHNELKKSYLLKVINPVLQKKYWCNPCCIYLTEHFIETKILEKYFEGNPDIYFLDEMYKDFKKENLLELGCLDKVRVKQRESNSYNGNISINNEHSNHKRGLDGFDPDCEIEGIEYALKNINKGRSIVIWNLLKQNYRSIAGVIESSSRQDYGYSKKEDMVSKMGKLVREAEWLLDKYGNFRKPSDIFLSELPDDFDKESTEARMLAEKLGFKKDIEQEFLSQLPEEKRKRYQFAENLTEEEMELIEKNRKLEKVSEERNEEESFGYADELKQSFNHPQLKMPEEDHIPPDDLPDPNRRRELTQAEIQESIGNEPPVSQRFKRVPVKKWEQKDNSVKRFLREQYGGKCQICNYVFYKRNGEPYFEGLYFVSRTKAAWIDRPGNVLCLCANCCAKLEHGHVEEDKILEQIYSFKCSNESETGNAIIKLKLCNKNVELKFAERHIVDLQEILKSAK